MGLKLVGLTGCIGSGKSTVAGIFQEKGLGYIDADQVSRDILSPGKTGWLALQASFGDRFFRRDGELDRPYMRSQIFSEHKLRRAIDSLLHPLIREQIRAQINNKQAGVTIVEVPLLFEAGWQADFDEIIVVYADKSQCLKRLQRRDGVGEIGAKAALASQMPLAEKKKMANRLLDNSGDMTTLVKLIDLILLSWQTVGWLPPGMLSTKP